MFREARKVDRNGKASLVNVEELEKKSSIAFLLSKKCLFVLIVVNMWDLFTAETKVLILCMRNRMAQENAKYM